MAGQCLVAHCHGILLRSNHTIALHCVRSDPVIWAQTCGSVSVPAQGEEPSARPYMEVSDIPYSSFEKQKQLHIVRFRRWCWFLSSTITSAGWDYDLSGSPTPIWCLFQSHHLRKANPIYERTISLASFDQETTRTKSEQKIFMVVPIQFAKRKLLCGVSSGKGCSQRMRSPDGEARVRRITSLMAKCPVRELCIGGSGHSVESVLHLVRQTSLICFSREVPDFPD